MSALGYGALAAALRQAETDAEFAAALAGVGCRIVLGFVDGPPPLVVHAGRDERDLRIEASGADWQRMCQPTPAPGWHSLTAALRQPAVAVCGDAVQLAQSLHALERLLEIARGQLRADEVPDADLSAIAGAYRRVVVDGTAVQLYCETAGTPGRPALVMLHTAGADARQYHALMTDAALAREWRLLAFDLPGHGRSPPPADAWCGYRLRKDRYRDLCLAVIEQVLQQPAALLGCSMGAAMALHAARESPRWVRAAIALEAPYRSAGRRTDKLAHAQVNQAAHNPSYVRGLMSPLSPLAQRRRAAWIYSQGGFGIYSGDLAFYSDEFDAAVDVAGLDGRHRPVVLLTGAYDYSASPADSRRVAELVPGATFIEMDDLGHFPMTENPAALMRHLGPVLHDVAWRLDAGLPT